MQYRTPSLDVFQPVLNIGTPELDHIKQELPNQREYVSVALQRTIHKLLSPTRPIVRAGLIDHTELGRLQHHVGLRGVNERHIDKLSEYLKGVLSQFSCEEPVHTSTLPTDVQPLGKGRLLTIAAAPELSQKRALLKGAISYFYNSDTVPEGVWMDDELMGRIWVARSFNTAMNRLLTRLDTTLTHQPDLLPESPELGEEAVEPHPPRDR